MELRFCLGFACTLEINTALIPSSGFQRHKLQAALRPSAPCAGDPVLISLPCAFPGRAFGLTNYPLQISICLLFYPLARSKMIRWLGSCVGSEGAVVLATSFDLLSRGRRDDFRVWVFAGSDVCFVRLVYLVLECLLGAGQPLVYPFCGCRHCSGECWEACGPFL